MKITIVELDPTGIELNRIESETSYLNMVDGFNMYLSRSRFVVMNEVNEIVGMFKILQDVNTMEITIDFIDILNGRRFE